MRVLLVDDEKKLVEALKYSISKAGYEIDAALDGRLGCDLALEKIYDLVILDRMLPNMDGIDILRTMRRSGVDTPVLMLTAKDTVDDRVEGLDSGADDYLVKPFATKELLARIRALDRRREGVRDNFVTVGNVSFCHASSCLECGGREIQLTYKENSIFRLLSENRNRAVGRGMLLEKIWGYESELESNSLDANISYLRRKLSSIDSGIEIKAVRGIGYMLRELS